MHLSSFHPSATFRVRNCCVHFMGKEMETKRVINWLKGPQGSSRDRIRPQTDCKACAPLAVLTTDCVRTH